MKHILVPALALSLALSGPAIQAQTAQSETEEGFDLMEEGARLLLRGLMTEMEPTMEDLRDLAQNMGPAMDDLRALAEQMGPELSAMMAKIDNIRHYQAPEILPNGDIIIRRKPDAPSWDPAAPDEGGDEIEL